MSELLTLALAIAVYLLLGRRGFWRADQLLEPAEPPDVWPSVAAIVPARNEAASIGACLDALANQDYPGPLQILLVDDQSSDDTAARARAVRARRPVRILAARPLAAGWSGKLAAMQHGVATVCAEAPPDYLWFTDADIVHEPGVLSALVSKAEADDCKLVSLMVRLPVVSFWEKLLVPAFLFFFQKLYPFPAVNDPDSEVAAAAGGCMLVHSASLQKAGGLPAIRGALIDDVALARLIKGYGHAIWLGLARTSRSLRRYERLPDFWAMVVRTAYTQLDHNPVYLAGTLLFMAITYLLAPLALIGLVFAAILPGSSDPPTKLLLLALVQPVLLIGLYLPTVRFCGLPALWGGFLPVSACLYTLMTADSARAHWHGRGGLWKGRLYSDTD